MVIKKTISRFPENDVTLELGDKEIKVAGIDFDNSKRLKRLEEEEQKAGTFTVESKDLAHALTVRRRDLRTNDREIEADVLYWDTVDQGIWGNDAGTTGFDWGDDTNTTFVVQRVQQGPDIYREDFDDDDYKDAGNTTATWTGTGSVTFTSGQIAQSSSIDLNNGDILAATLTSTETSGSFDYVISNGSGSFDAVTSGVKHFFDISSPQIIESDDNDNGFFTTATSTGRDGQTFTIGNTGVNGNAALTSVKFKIFRVGSPGTITCELRAVDGDGKPTASILSSGTVNGNTITTSTDGEFVEFTMSAFTLLSSTTYAIVFFGSTISSGNEIGFRMDNSPTYSGGSAVFSSDSGSTWSLNTSLDAAFQVLGISNQNLIFKATENAASTGEISNINIDIFH